MAFRVREPRPLRVHPKDGATPGGCGEKRIRAEVNTTHRLVNPFHAREFTWLCIQHSTSRPRAPLRRAIYLGNSRDRGSSFPR